MVARPLRVRDVFAQMRRAHHRAQRRFDRTSGIGQEIGDACEGLVGFRIEDMQDRADEQRMAGFFPMVSLVERTLRIDEDVGDFLHVADLLVAAPHLQQRVVGRGCGIGRIEQQHAAMPGSEAGGQTPVLAFDVVDDRAARPG